MSAVITSLLKAFGQLGDPAVLRILAKSMAITLAIFAIGGSATLYALYHALIAWGVGFSAELSSIAALIFTLTAGWFLFRIVAIAVLQFFADEVVLAVERKHYPVEAQQARALPFREDLSNSLRGIVRTLLVNLVALPVALILLFTAIGPAVVFFLANAILLGRELTDMAWLRHQFEPETGSPVSPAQRFALGAAVAGLMVIPFLNLLAPILGAAAGTHLLHTCRKANAK
ncbi:EI24 domain-containing protein [Altererythrobacter sp.]|uniref:EI24 domain-containing protein n=1 Tax=Altererythrobacter sp. TaxID=1872480 RepID=UPI003CFD0BB2